MNYRPRDPASELALALANARDRGRERDRACARACVHACTRYLHLATPRVLVVLAAQLLPIAQRARYCEEFLVEIVELPRLERWGYGLRVLASAWQLRQALDEAARAPNDALPRTTGSQQPSPN